MKKIFYSKYAEDSDFTISDITEEGDVLIEMYIRHDNAHHYIDKEKAKRIIDHLKEQFEL